MHEPSIVIETDTVYRPSAGARRCLFVCLVAIVALGVLELTRVIGQTAYWFGFVALLAFMLGMAAEAARHAEELRRVAVEQTERFIAWGHWALDGDDVPDERREDLEQALGQAQTMLGFMDRAAPVHVKLRRRLSHARR